MTLPFLNFSKRVWLLPVFLMGIGLLQGCNNSSNSGLSTEQIAQDQKRYMQQVNSCFLREYSSLETFDEPLYQLTVALRDKCTDEFSALRAAKLNYVMVRDVVEPPPRMVQFELEITQVFVETARARARAIFKQHPLLPAVPNNSSQSKSVDVF